MSSPRIAARGAGARSRARAKRPKAVPCAERRRPTGPWSFPRSPRWRDEAAGVERGAQRRRSEHRNCTHARAPRQCQRFRRRVGGADASAEERPGAALARDNAGPRSAAREHRRRVRRRVSESGPAQRMRSGLLPPGPSATARRAHRTTTAVSAQLVGPQGSPQRASAKRRRCPGGARGRREATRSASLTAGASPMEPIGLRGATRRVPEGGPRRGPWHAPCGAPVPLLAPRAGAVRGRLLSTAPAGAVRAPLRAGALVDRHDLAEGVEREDDQGDDAEDEHERATPSAPGGGAVELPLFTGRAGGGPRPSPSRPVKPRRVASLRPRAASGPCRTAAARRPSARLGLTRFSCVPRAVRREGAPTPPSGAA